MVEQYPLPCPGCGEMTATVDRRERLVSPWPAFGSSPVRFAVRLWPFIVCLCGCDIPSSRP